MTLEEYRRNLLPSERKRFDEFIDIGIMKTIYALLDAEVADQEIKRVVSKHWNTSHDEFVSMLTDAKISAALDLVWENLQLGGYTAYEADEFLINNSIKIKLSQNHELLAYWNKPDKLIKAVCPKKKHKEK